MKPVVLFLIAVLATALAEASDLNPIRLRITQKDYQILNCRMNAEPGPRDGVWGSTCDHWRIYRANGIGRLLIKDDYRMYIRNSGKYTINSYSLNREQAAEYILLLSTASSRCPVHVTINRQSLEVESIRPTCDPLD